MNNTFVRHIAATAIAVLGLLATSCSQTDEPVNKAPESMQVKFTVAELNQASRDGTWADAYPTLVPTSAEKAINKLYGYLVSNGTVVGKLTNLANNGGNYTADITPSEGVTYPDLKDKTVTLHLLANCDIEVDPTTENGLKEYWKIFTISTAPDYIPMWGCGTCTIVESTETEQQLDASFGAIYMLRSMAKVEVTLTNTGNTTDVLNSVTLSGYVDDHSYVVPPYAPVGITATGELNRYNEDISTSDTPRSRNITVNATDNKAVFYVPEQINSTSSEIQIGVKVNGTNLTSKIYFRDYKNGIAGDTPKNIMRNHAYRFTVILDKGQLTVLSTDWEYTVENKFDF